MAQSPEIRAAEDRYLPRATSDSKGDFDNGNMNVCAKCGHEIRIGDFPFCKGNPSDHGKGTPQAIADSIPGGLEVRHGLCNLDGSPRTYYSHSEIKREAEKRGLTNVVTHVPSQGSDKNKHNHTTRWI
jgi:hypothetical protein